MYVKALWRYPVKSMLGEALELAEVGYDGLSGDRAYAVYDHDTGFLASCKNPYLYGRLLYLQAMLNPSLKIKLPSGEVLEGGGISWGLSQFLGRRISLISNAEGRMKYLGYWPRIEELSHRQEYEVGETMENSFKDSAPVHVVFEENLGMLASQLGEAAAERFRPNIVVCAGSPVREEEVIDRELVAGGVRLKAIRRTRRCVITTLPQPGLGRKNEILKKIYSDYRGFMGFYCTVLEPGLIRLGDTVKLL
ncbi:hypothetical protein HRbin01_00892 [archaeon HR01]|nr:hypothetical protein HRbin01_00892 [archaeon HR01]